jgi:Zn-dependent protease
MAWVAAAGPGANLAMALGWALLLKLALELPLNFFTSPMAEMAKAGIVVNLVFMFLNLLPILPLDGGRILTSLLPDRMAWQYSKLEPWGLPVLLLLLVTNVLDGILGPLVTHSVALLRSAVFL